MRIQIQSTALMLVLSLTLAGNSLAQDSNQPKTTASTSSTINVESESKNDAQVMYIVYFSAHASSNARIAIAQERLESSNNAVLMANKKLNGDGGMRNIVSSTGLNDLAKRLPGGMEEARRLVPMIEDGWHVLLIMNHDETEWSKPVVLSPYLDVFEQIKFARNEDKKSNPKRYLASSGVRLSSVSLAPGRPR